MNKLIASILFTALSATPAHAESKYAPQHLTQVAWWLHRTKQGKPFHRLETNLLQSDASGVTHCQAAINKARDDGATTIHSDAFEHFGGTRQGSYWTLTLGQAEGICREAVFYQDVVLKDVNMFRSINVSFDGLVGSGFKPDGLAPLRADAERCEAAVDAMLAANVSPSLPFPINRDVATVADLKPKLCVKAREALDKFFAYYKQEQANEREPFIKAGIKGDKLDFVLQYDGYIYLAGGVTTDSIKKLAASSTFFIWTTSDPDASDYVVHTVRKHVFKGNKFVRTSEKTYRKPRGASLGSGPFK